MVKKTVTVLVVLILIASGGWWFLYRDKSNDPAPVPVSAPDEEALLASLITNEDLLLDLTRGLISLADWIQLNSTRQDAELPPQLRSLVRVRGLVASQPAFTRASHDMPGYVYGADWPVATQESNQPTDPWAPLKQLGVTWETLKFGVVRAGLDSPDRFTMQTKAEARGAHPGGAVFGLKARQDLGFRLIDGMWHLTDWIQVDAHLFRSRRPLFEEVASAALPNAETLEAARRSRHRDVILAFARTGSVPITNPRHAPWTWAQSNHYFPAVSTVDYDGDGDDDLFLTARWGYTQLLRNNGDGTFTDVAEDVGLRVEGMVNCALFVDLDNDGDKDVILGRAMEAAQYLRNDEGHFRNVTAEQSNLGEVYFTSAISASDVNRDGLLDIYLSTYPPLDKANLDWAGEFLTEEEARILAVKRREDHRYLNSIGSSNVLLMNRGNGVLERVPYDDMLSQWHRSYQTGWADYDNDGDDDLYICNDFAPDALLRNDTPRGAAQPQFTDVTGQVVLGHALGNGMGVSWGDYDADGDLDLYVSNMYSKAGKRIISHLQTVDPRIRASAAGSCLFENRGGLLHQRAGSAADEFRVHQVGWAWGGQWADFDNDGRLDLYAPSGYYTAPEELDTQVDN